MCVHIALASCCFFLLPFPPLFLLPSLLSFNPSVPASILPSLPSLPSFPLSLQSSLYLSSPSFFSSPCPFSSFPVPYPPSLLPSCLLPFCPSLPSLPSFTILLCYIFGSLNRILKQQPLLENWMKGREKLYSVSYL